MLFSESRSVMLCFASTRSVAALSAPLVCFSRMASAAARVVSQAADMSFSRIHASVSPYIGAASLASKLQCQASKLEEYVQHISTKRAGCIAGRAAATVYPCTLQKQAAAQTQVWRLSTLVSFPSAQVQGLFTDLQNLLLCFLKQYCEHCSYSAFP